MKTTTGSFESWPVPEATAQALGGEQQGHHTVVDGRRWLYCPNRGVPGVHATFGIVSGKWIESIFVS